MHRTGASIDGDIQKTFPPVPIFCLQFWQMLHIDMNITGIVIPELSLPPNRSGFWCRWQSVQSGIFQYPPDIVPVQMRQEMSHDEGQVTQTKSGGTSKLTDNGALFLRGFPDQFPGTTAAVLAGVRTTPAPLANSFITDPVTSGEYGRRFRRTGYVGPDGGCRACLWVDLKHHSLSLQTEENNGA